MYRQIHSDNIYLQNVLWRNDFRDDISIFELQTVTYGTSRAPYLAIKCLKHLTSINRDKFPTACEVIDRDMYVDDLMTGFDNEVHGAAFCNQVSIASFSLRKWASNSHVILKGLSDTFHTFEILDFGENESAKTLSIQWSNQSDLLSFKVSIPSLNARRGTPSHLYFDNATNFVASQEELIKFYKFLQNSENELIALCSKENITWHFIPPNSPNFGGLWESNIKAIKYHVYKIAVLNSRPLHPMSSDTNDLTPLTPSHLLIGTLMITPPIYSTMGRQIGCPDFK
ncbi:hypothetical protein HUJ04_008259 [Dendroctonus ponderosae]|nr:hypothetical protein HUJ04_008259 [Dendroctonus ponderosae]